ncbi:coiled-coil domain-containing protein 183-like [Falco naumanni]|uniref:coiled-coil domain-containing protein 183-like n=1 Tax=Falco naumanni TaxID=148594 RepID=UPI001ADE70B8|nr:coiled-coil domain-containing protein 183-like [Falco naumanni]XP_040436882.1 coiled-coil domain-containing protein 183-like [Falco naumanni]XP_040436901.1 coiled-coil domain-containing protein 183-like [Falco naumanni]
MPIQVAQEKLQADTYERVNTCNMLLRQVRQRRQVREELQRRLQQLQDAAMPDKRQQAQAQAICQLEKNIEKVLLKVHTGQKVTALYLAVRDVLRKELAHLPPHLDLLCKVAELYGRELQDMDLMALKACKAADRAKVRWPGAPRGPFPPSRAHRRHHVPRSCWVCLQPRAKEPELGLPTAPRWLHSSSRVSLLGRAALGLGTACPKPQLRRRQHAPPASPPCPLSFPACLLGDGAGHC